MADIGEEVHQILSKHCDELNQLTDQLQKELVKLHREKCEDTGLFCEMDFLESCLLGLRTMMILRNAQRKATESKLN